MTGFARCNLDGRPLSPADERAILDFGVTLLLRQADKDLQWCELVSARGQDGPYWRKWYCPQPGIRQVWRAVRQEWAEPGEDGLPVRRIYEIEITDARTPDAAAAGHPERTGQAGPGSGPAAGAGAARPAEAEAPAQGADRAGRDAGTGGVPR
jgi:hypothetical protein